MKMLHNNIPPVFRRDVERRQRVIRRDNCPTSGWLIYPPNSTASVS